MSERCSTQIYAHLYRLLAVLLPRKNKTIAIIGFVTEWKKAQNKYTENYVNKLATYNAENQNLLLILPFALLLRCV
jgi:hypothetical protein